MRTLVSGARAPGFYEVTWDGRDERGRALPAGVYLYRLSADQSVKTGSVIVLK